MEMLEAAIHLPRQLIAVLGHRLEVYLFLALSLFTKS